MDPENMSKRVEETEECALCGPDCICEEVKSQYGCMQTEGVVLTENGPRFASELSLSVRQESE